VAFFSSKHNPKWVKASGTGYLITPNELKARPMHGIQG